VLNLPDNSLTKEIQLTQDLMEMFIKYQVPSDLLSYDADADVDADAISGSAAGAVGQAEKIAAVKEHVGQIKAVIAAQREAELVAAAEAKAKALLEAREREEARIQRQQQQQNEMMYAQRRTVARGSMGPRGGGGGAMAFGAPPMMAPQMMAMESCAAPMAMAMDDGLTESIRGDKKMKKKSAAAAAVVTPPQQHAAGGSSGAPELAREEMDYTALPALLDSMFAELDTDSALCPTIIKMGPTWTRTSQAGLLSKPTTSTLRDTEQKDEKNQAFDLLDALTRSGALDVAEASLHVVLAATHCFDKTVVNAVVQDNINPVEKVERSVLIVSSAISGLPAQQLIKQDQLERVQLYSPMLLPALAEIP